MEFPARPVRIACLHTARSNVVVFEAAGSAFQAGGFAFTHRVRPDLLEAVERAGHLAPAISEATRNVLEELAQEADAVLLTCSSLGPVAALVRAAVPVLRADAALATQAVRAGGRVVALCAVDTTVEVTRALFQQAAQHTGAEVDVRLVADAWGHFKAGRETQYLTMIAGAADEAYAQGADVVALAQASMAAAADLARHARRPLSSPACAIALAIRLAQGAGPR